MLETATKTANKLRITANKLPILDAGDFAAGHPTCGALKPILLIEVNPFEGIWQSYAGHAIKTTLPCQATAAATRRDRFTFASVRVLRARPRILRPKYRGWRRRLPPGSSRPSAINRR